MFWVKAVGAMILLTWAMSLIAVSFIMADGEKSLIMTQRAIAGVLTYGAVLLMMEG